MADNVIPLDQGHFRAGRRARLLFNSSLPVARQQSFFYAVDDAPLTPAGACSSLHGADTARQAHRALCGWRHGDAAAPSHFASYDAKLAFQHGRDQSHPQKLRCLAAALQKQKAEKLRLKKAASKTPFICPGCELPQRLWGKSSLNVICGECGERFVASCDDHSWPDESSSPD